MIYLLFAWIRQSDGVGGVLAAAGKMFDYFFNNGGVFTGMLYMGVGIFISYALHTCTQYETS